MPEQRFHTHWFRFLIPAGFAAVAFVSLAIRVPEAAVPAAIFGPLVIAFAAFLHHGLILTEDGIVWYTMHPRVVYRRVPWSAVKNVRTGWFGRRLHLETEPDSYEPVLWGRSRDPITIHTLGLARGEELFEAIESFRRPLTSLHSDPPTGSSP